MASKKITQWPYSIVLGIMAALFGFIMYQLLFVQNREDSDLWIPILGFLFAAKYIFGGGCGRTCASKANHDEQQFPS